MTYAAPGFGYISVGVSEGDNYKPKYRVVNACVLVKTRAGTIQHAYEGCLLEDLMPEQEWWLEAGLVELVDQAAPAEPEPAPAVAEAGKK